VLQTSDVENMDEFLSATSVSGEKNSDKEKVLRRKVSVV
jgi:hypothetical protein